MRFSDMFSLEKTNNDETLDKAVQNYINIAECLKGISDIVHISLSKDDFYTELTMDNLVILHNNILDLIENDEGVKQLKRKILNKEIKVDRTLNFFFDE